ncbi:MAG: M4 family metallopeptidase [Planctomycetota bacterium]
MSSTRRFVQGGAGWLATALSMCVVAVVTKETLGQAVNGETKIRRSQVTGLASFVSRDDGGPLLVEMQGGVAAASKDPMEFLLTNGSVFGVSDPKTQLQFTKVAPDALGRLTTTYQQMHDDIPVFSGMLKVHQDSIGQVTAANGDFYPIPAKLLTTPRLTADAAVAGARTALGVGQPRVEKSELVIVDPGWYGDPPIGAHLAYHVVLTDLSVPVSEAFFVDAQTGTVLDRWSMIHTARVREIYDGLGGGALPGALIRDEGDPPVGSPADANRAYDYAGDTYDYYFRAFGRDSIDDSGMTLILTVNSTAPPCPNAFWNSTQMVFCLGTVTDDVTAHEMTHGVTERTAGLIYQNQSGQLNEAYSDIFGEMIDQFNGNAAFPGTPGGLPSWPTHPTGPGLDTPNNGRTASCSDSPGHVDGVRWLVGEDATAFGGAIRDMWNPPCEGDPDRANSPLQTCNSADSGGVHSGSGIANHAYAIMTDGKTFNGYTVSAIGPIKTGAVWYRALTVYLTPVSDFMDAYDALNQAALDLIGTTPNDPRDGLPSASMFTAADALEVDKALLAVEMNTDGRCGSNLNNLNPTPPVQCDTPVVVFADDFEGGVNGWTVSNTAPPTPYDWVQTSDLVAGQTGTAWFVADPEVGDCAGQDESAVHSLFSPVIAMPAVLSRPTLSFTHFLATETGFDAGTMQIRVNAGAWQNVPMTAFLYNPYNMALVAAAQGSTNPKASEPSWCGAGGVWGTTLIDLSGFVTGGQTVQIRFDLSKDGCTGVVGWYVDDLSIYTCTCDSNGDCDDGRYCNGAETCVGGVCQAGTDRCDTIFSENYDAGNGQGWTLSGAGSTAITGTWIFGDPNGTRGTVGQAQPDTPNAGAGCAFTAQNSTPAVDDVDGGVTYLVSPNINLGSRIRAELNYVRWFHNRDRGIDVDDFFVVEASSNGGANWVSLETLGTGQSAQIWAPRTVALHDFISLTSTMRIRFGASDGTAVGNLIEAAVDDFSVRANDFCNIDADCDDGAFCNGAETCVASNCQPGTPPVLDDGVACTVDTCDELNDVIVHLPNDAACSNGVYCDGIETCSATLGCQGGTPVNCDDGIACTADSCNEGTDTCDHVPNDALCDDGLFCTGTETCSVTLGCQSSGDPCPGESCDEVNDECIPLICDPPVVVVNGPRYLNITPAAALAPVALLVIGDAGDPNVACVLQFVQPDGSLDLAPVFALPSVWGSVDVHGEALIPGAQYGVMTLCGPGLSVEVSVQMNEWGDIDDTGVVDVDDLVILLEGFAGNFLVVPQPAVDLLNCDPDGVIDVDDLLGLLEAISGNSYFLICPPPCP